MRILASVLAVVTFIMISNTAAAVNFYDGSRAPKGLYFLTYSTAYFADKVTDSKGNTAIKDYDLLKVEELMRFCYYSPDFVFTALLPSGGVHVGQTDKNSFGLGDASIGGGWFLPVKEVDILPMLFVKVPTGEYASDKSTNYGTHQVDIKPEIFFHKTVNSFSMDAAAKYFFRLENDNNIAPGDELHLEYLLGYDITKNLKLGPSISWMISQDKRVDGVKVSGSARQTFSAGAEFYTKFSGRSFDFSYLYDAFAQNSPKGHFFQLKSCYKF